MACLFPNPPPPSYLIMTLKPSSSHLFPRLLICSPGQTNSPPLPRHTNKNPSQPEMSLRDLNPVSKDRDISNTSQKHFKRGVFFVTSLRRLKYISKRTFFCDVFKTSQIHLIKYVFFVMSLRLLRKHLIKCIFCDVFKTSQIHLKKCLLCDVSECICDCSKISHKNGFR